MGIILFQVMEDTFSFELGHDSIVCELVNTSLDIGFGICDKGIKFRAPFIIFIWCL